MPRPLMKTRPRKPERRAFGPPPVWAGLPSGFTVALLNPTVQEIARRRPKLTLPADAAASDGVIVAPAARPRP